MKPTMYKYETQSTNTSGRVEHTVIYAHRGDRGDTDGWGGVKGEGGDRSMPLMLPTARRAETNYLGHSCNPCAH